MAQLSDLNVYTNLLFEKQKNRWSIDRYNLKINNYLRRILYKLKALDMITDLKIVDQKAVFRLKNLLKVKFYNKPTDVLNLKNYRSLLKQKIQNSTYHTLLVSTTKGLKTIKEAVKEKIGGYVIGFLVSKTPILNRK